MVRVFILVLGLVAFIPGAYAQGTAAQEAPLEITADETLEWHRAELQYVARGNVAATQGGVTIHADLMTADYRESAASNTEIYRLTATGNVKIISEGNEAYGDKAVYEVDKGAAVMTGSALKMVSPDQTVTARDKFEYEVNTGRLTAHGNARAVRGEDVIESDRLAAIFAEGKNGQSAGGGLTGGRNLERLEATGNVRITTPTEKLTGARAVYDAKTNIAEIHDNVVITRGPNELKGARADVNLTTNISRMFGGEEGGEKGRVRAVFYPGSDAKPTEAQRQATPPAVAPQPAPAPTLPPADGLIFPADPATSRPYVATP